MNVGIIGSGTMGSGIAQVAATADCQVKIFDTNSEALEHARSSLDRILNRLIEKERIGEEEKYRIQANISYVNSLADLAES
ncbi:MAG: 3-hydroxybutyryl-CoA dehydrogenase, partial [Bacteroidia bacterium]|nr:3-hydroxybutyryl-CoA dehydrogenase [Bacteroidia bacterium]